jgi:putative phage-type endonuclease
MDFSVAQPTIGGSQAAAAAGISRWKSQIEVWQELLGEAEPFTGNQYTHWGTVLEPAIREEYARRNEVEIVVPQDSFFRDGWKRATPDGIVQSTEKRGLEVKTGDKFTADSWGEPGSDEVPIEYRAQSVWYMHVTDLPRWDFAVLIGGNAYAEYTVLRDLDIEQKLVSQVDQFRSEYLIPKVPPRPDGSEGFKRYLAKKWPDVSMTFLKATSEVNELVGKYKYAVCALKKLEHLKELLEQELRIVIGPDAGIDSEHGRITCNPKQGAKRTNWEGLIAQLVHDFPIDSEYLAKLRADFTTRDAPSRPLRRPNNWTKELGE